MTRISRTVRFIPQVLRDTLRYVAEVMSEYRISVERDSVWMGDDVGAPQSYCFMLPDDAVLNDVFTHLAKKSYLVSVVENNYSRKAIVNDNKLAIFVSNSFLSNGSSMLSNKIAKYLKVDTLNVSFQYNSAAT